MTTAGRTLPPIMHVGVYRLNAPPFEKTWDMFQSDRMSVTITNGPLVLERSVPSVSFPPDGAGMTSRVERLEFSVGPYFVVRTLHDFDAPDIHGTGQRETSEWAALVDLCFPALVAFQEFQGVVSQPKQMVMIPEGPIRLTARPFEGLGVLQAELSVAHAAIGSLVQSDRHRFQLACRWFRRGEETLSRVDKLLFWYISLEVFPAKGTSDVPGAVRDLIHDKVYPSVAPAVIKDRIGIGPIAGLRSSVVHDGKGSVDEGDEELFENRLEQLEAIVRTCLRVLAGLPPGSALDRWVTI